MIKKLKKVKPMKAVTEKAFVNKAKRLANGIETIKNPAERKAMREKHVELLARLVIRSLQTAQKSVCLTNRAVKLCAEAQDLCEEAQARAAPKPRRRARKAA